MNPAGERTRQTLCGFRRAAAGRGAGQVDGTRWEEANRMAELAGSRGTGDLRDALLLRIMSDCLLRGAEASALDVSDIRFVDGWLHVEARRSKTDQEGRGSRRRCRDRRAVVSGWSWRHRRVPLRACRWPMSRRRVRHRPGVAAVPGKRRVRDVLHRVGRGTRVSPIGPDVPKSRATSARRRRGSREAPRARSPTPCRTRNACVPNRPTRTAAVKAVTLNSMVDRLIGKVAEERPDAVDLGTCRT